ncbi:MAG: hypothetical protein JW984_12985 [Deltaproteobacteria bacterium]|uniref:Uncharacterized protein n=1 Tax=Candidatus Zymogenus saltonus TaxID=2844893 RepID=A0A9D8KG78_9DELT|nr:hypothetical protein [Candidatus Zymogenus saltonus]
MGYFFAFLGVIAFAASLYFWGQIYFYILAIGGFLSFIYGIKTIQVARKEGIKKSASSKVDRLARDKRIPTKICPTCAKEIEASSKVCPFCNHHYQIIYSLTVFAPMDRKQRESLVKTLSAKTGKSASAISLELDRGMVFKFTKRELYLKNKQIFENIGCRVKVAEILSNR